ncbi:MAG: hypothetical protein QXE22_05675 [Candidatus Bathyarchaeia archaeon]
MDGDGVEDFRRWPEGYRRLEKSSFSSYATTDRRRLSRFRERDFFEEWFNPMTKKKKVIKIRASPRTLEALEEIQEKAGPVTVSLIFKAALEHYRKYVRAVKEFEDQYLRSLAEEAVKNTAYRLHDFEYYVRKALELYGKPVLGQKITKEDETASQQSTEAKWSG